jgi:hypothetical protein
MNEAMSWQKAVEILELHHLFLCLKQDIDFVTREELVQAMEIVLWELKVAKSELEKDLEE